MFFPLKPCRVSCLLCLFSIGTLLSSSCRVFAQADIVVKKAGAEKTSVDLSGLVVAAVPDGAGFLRILGNDLVRSGWFTLAPQGSAIHLRGLLKQSERAHSVSFELLNSTSGKTYLRSSLSRQELRSLAHALADEMVEAVYGVKGIASTRIAMIGSHGARKDLYICDADGGNLVKITNQGAVCLSPEWWPDSTALVYTSFHAKYPDIYRIDLTKNRRTKLSGYPGLNAGAAISPDGRSMALILSKDGNPDLYIMDLRRQGLTRITRSTRSAEASPSWSPDGKQLVFVSDTSGSPQIYVIKVGDTQPARITFRGKENVAPDWGVDGRIAYSSRREGRYQICVYTPASGQTEQLTREYCDHEDPSWAPDGRHIIYARTANYRSTLYILDTMGDASLPLNTMEGDWYSPAWSMR